MQQAAARTGVPLERLVAAARPTLLFVVAYALNTTPHEAVHAFTAYLLGFNSTIFQMWVNPDQTTATAGQLAEIAVTGPIFSLTAGVLCLLFYASRFRNRPAGLILLMLALVGIDCFLGPLAAAALGGDIHTALVFLGTPAWVCDALSGAGLLMLSVFMFRIGRELARWAPAEFGRAATVLSATVAPAVIGTLLILPLYWPLPQMLVGSTISGSVLWIPAIIGAALAFKSREPQCAQLGFTKADAWVAVAAIAMVRIFATGIRLAH